MMVIGAKLILSHRFSFLNSFERRASQFHYVQCNKGLDQGSGTAQNVLETFHLTHQSFLDLSSSMKLQSYVMTYFYLFLSVKVKNKGLYHCFCYILAVLVSCIVILVVL